LSKDHVSGDIAGAACRIEGSQGLIVFEQAIVERIGDEQISHTVETDAKGLAHVGGTWRRGSRRAGAYRARETGAAASLAEDAISGRVPCAGGRIERRQRFIEFENSRVLLVGYEQVAHRIDRQPARAA
jgi:hypothetical protein